MEILKRLFGKKHSSDGLTQREREAIVDLLLLCTYADNHLSLAEDKVMKGEIESFDWDSGTSLDFYMCQATDRVRRSRTEGPALDELLKFIGDRLESDYANERAREVMEKLFVSDGQTPQERQFAERVLQFLS